VLAPATLAALPSTRAIPDRDVFHVAHPIRSIRFSLDLDCYLSGGVRSLREACLDWSDAHGEKDSLPSGVVGAQIRHEIPSAFVAQSLLSAGPFARLARRHSRSSGAGALR
jgi:hypothetical protein